MNIILRKIYYRLPVSFRYIIRRIFYFPQDFFANKSADLVPPKGLIFIGSGDYLKIGNRYFNLFQKYCDFTPNGAILDIGCGIGRMAIPFLSYLSPNGRYEGFDIVKLGIDWCTNNITNKFSNFNFKLIPLENNLYISNTNNKASELVFPYESNTFDLVFLTSVFTHMLPLDVENYLKEIQRVLKTGQKCFVTFFILDEESTQSMKKNGSKNFPYQMGNYSLMDKTLKEANIAYNKEFIFSLLQKYDLELCLFERGSWSGINTTVENEHQDIIIFKKK